MKKRPTHRFSFRYFFFLICLFFIQNIFSQNMLQVDGKKIVNGNGEEIILRGMGLGGWMLQEGYMMQTADFAPTQHELKEKIAELIGEVDMEAFYDAWHSNFVQKADIDSLKAWGFNSVRLPMHYNLYTLPIEDEPVAGQQTWLDKGFIMTDSLLSWCAQNEMYLILDLHAAPGGQGYDAGISDYDPDKPSLWESQANKDKTVALWTRLAERYVGEEWIGGYDLINEVNWDLPGGVALRALYEAITDGIRLVDQEHIIFIEGNWFANDFTGLLPPWDDQICYSFHKYWSYNDQASIQWVLDMQNQYDIPLWMGESGENSNVWFRDAIRLIEEHEIGWAWWNMKKVGNLTSPYAIEMSSNYEFLLNYWKGQGSEPTVDFAKNALMELAENAKSENCLYRKDVPDALIRQVDTDETKPFSNNQIPGLILLSNFDLGSNGEAYFDYSDANYHLSTGNYTPWNSGWGYRNDGVDIEYCSDNINTNGYNIGFLENGEWLKYTVNVTSSAVYNINVRVAAQGSAGRFFLQQDGVKITPAQQVSNTGGWQSWNTMMIENVVLQQGVQELIFYTDVGNFNISSFEFVEVGSTTSVDADFVYGKTLLDKHSIVVDFNKDLTASLPTAPGGFELMVDNNTVPVVNIQPVAGQPRQLLLETSHTIEEGDLIFLSYAGNQIQATDGTSLANFSMKWIQNFVSNRHLIPGKIEVEDFSDMVGMQVETTNDDNGGLHLGFTDAGDYAEYLISIAEAAEYKVNFRVASENSFGKVNLWLVTGTDEVLLDQVSFPVTGSWEDWVTVFKPMDLPAGDYLLRMEVTQPGFNINWIDFELPVATEEIAEHLNFEIFPNPASNFIYLKNEFSENTDVEILIANQLGQPIFSKKINDVNVLFEKIEIQNFPKGMYLVTLKNEHQFFTKKIIVR